VLCITTATKLVVYFNYRPKLLDESELKVVLLGNEPVSSNTNIHLTVETLL